jgi:hypothetical protein
MESSHPLETQRKRYVVKSRGRRVAEKDLGRQARREHPTACPKVVAGSGGCPYAVDPGVEIDSA